MRRIDVFKGIEISNEIITKIKEITRIRCTKPVYNSNSWSLESVYYLAELHGISVEDEILILGEDWFLCYRISENIVEFLEWIAENKPGTKFIQSIEMMKSLQHIFLQHKEKIFTTAMRHNGSYPFYLKMLQRGYFKEISHTIDIDICNGFAPERLKYLEEEYSSLDNFLNSEEANNNPEYLTYILHCLEFNVTDAYVERCMKLSKKL